MKEQLPSKEWVFCVSGMMQVGPGRTPGNEEYAPEGSRFVLLEDYERLQKDVRYYSELAHAPIEITTVKLSVEDAIDASINQRINSKSQYKRLVVQGAIQPPVVDSALKLIREVHEALQCGRAGNHYCSHCDNSLYEITEEVALFAIRHRLTKGTEHE